MTLNVFSQALGTAINSTKVMKAQQVVKTEDGGEVRTAGKLHCLLKLLYIKLPPHRGSQMIGECVRCGVYLWTGDVVYWC